MRNNRSRSGTPASRRGHAHDIRPALQSLWQQWQALSPKPALDRWLRSQRHPKADLSQVLTLSEAMFFALRFQQLACALETLLQRETTDLSEWDQHWQEQDSGRMHATAFWHWIELRSQRRWGFAAAVRQQEARQALFRRLEARVKAEPDSALAMLWRGLRPQWQPLLQQRAALSHWSAQDLQRFMTLQNQPPPLWLRPNPLLNQASLAELQQQLLDDGVTAQLRDGNLCATGGTGIQQSTPFRQGRIEIQDLASQQIAAALAPQPGEKIWDACAGAGGKSLALAAALHNKGALIATDLHAYKLDELKRRASRAGVRNIRTFTWSGSEPLRLPQEVARQGGFDKVLIDAPCSASGTWRRNPDARWRFQPQALAELLTLQQQLLTQAAAAVRPGGLLAYATCSWLHAENEQQVAAFAAHSGFTLREQRLLGAPQDDSDCMFVAVLQRPL